MNNCAMPFPGTLPDYFSNLPNHPELLELNNIALSSGVSNPATVETNAINLQEAERLLCRLCGDSLRTYQVFPDRDEDKNKPGSAKHFNHDNESMTTLAQMNKEGCGIFVMVNEGDGKGRATTNVIRVRSFFVDLDGAPLEPVLQAAIKPHIIVESSSGRYHAYWLVIDCPLEKFKPMQKALAEKFGGDKSVHDLPRVMRIPGFLHQKAKKGQTTKPFQSLIVNISDAEPYHFADIISGLGLSIDSSSDFSQRSPDQREQKPSSYDFKTILSALKYIDAEPYADWIKVGMAIKNECGDTGLDAWLEWSSASTKFDDSEAREKWATFDKREHGDIVTCRTIIKMARDNGWTPQNETAPEDNTASLTAAVNRLAKLSPLEYDKVRKEEAKRLGVRPGTLDNSVKGARKEEVNDSPFDVVEPWAERVDGADLLSTIAMTVRRFIICGKETAQAVALWIAMTWFIDVVQVAPLAVITAPEKRCGKSMLLFLIGKLVLRPLMSSSISPSALFRAIDAWKPTLLIDEVDACLKDNEELRGLINCGHTRDSAFTIRCVGDDHTPKRFGVWGAKALSGIGHVADTLMDRSIILMLRRKLPHESVERLRHAEPGLFDSLRSKLARFAEDNAEQVRLARPDLPPSLNDRAQDNWEPLLAIAAVAGGDWPKIATTAALKLSGGESLSQSVGTELLADIQEIFEHKKIVRISTADLINALCSDAEKPWATYNRGNPIKPRQIAIMLNSYGIHSKTIRVSYGGTPKGYDLNQFIEVFSRYLSPPVSATTPQVTVDKGLAVAVTETNTPQVELKRHSDTTCGGYKTPVADYKKLSATLKPTVDAGCGVVADNNPFPLGIDFDLIGLPFSNNATTSIGGPK